jgi:uncharacterized membrane protein YeaQ/YmgE (transglycosylase-associated protein family)
VGCSLFPLIAIAILIKVVGSRLAPIFMPSGWRETIASGWVGGLVGSLVDDALWQFGPSVAGINLIAALIGSSLFILALGLFPFIKILVGRT